MFQTLGALWRFHTVSIFLYLPPVSFVNLNIVLWLYQVAFIRCLYQVDFYIPEKLFSETAWSLAERRSSESINFLTKPSLICLNSLLYISVQRLRSATKKTISLKWFHSHFCLPVNPIMALALISMSISIFPDCHLHSSC